MTTEDIGIQQSEMDLYNDPYFISLGWRLVERGMTKPEELGPTILAELFRDGYELVKPGESAIRAAENKQITHDRNSLISRCKILEARLGDIREAATDDRVRK
jgi:hypothetical protein